jgi:hypothetical protein
MGTKHSLLGKEHRQQMLEFEVLRKYLDISKLRIQTTVLCNKGLLYIYESEF